MTLLPDFSSIQVTLAHLEADLTSASTALAAASTADWVSTSADLFRARLSDAQRCIATLDLSVDGVRAAVGRML